MTYRPVIMKRYYTVVLLLCLVAQAGAAQTFFEYDQTGNRIRRYYTPVPDLTPSLYVQHSTVYGTTNTNVVVYVYELKGVATTGTITCKLTKDARIALSFNPGATSVGGRPVQNSAWSFSGPSGGLYTLTTTQAIAAGEVLSVGLIATITPNGTTGQANMASVIVGGSGGEVRIDNNASSRKINYFPN